MDYKIAIMITTVGVRRKVLKENIMSLIKYITTPFTVYIYNDMGDPLYDDLKMLLDDNTSSLSSLIILNDQKEINKESVGCGGARHYLFKTIRDQYDIVISLDDDMIITRGWFEAILKAIEDHPNHSVFTGIVKNHNGKIIAGSNMSVTETTLTRKEIRTIPTSGTYHYSDWGPFGCLVLCRKVLHEKIEVPPLFVKEDSAFFMICRELGINETVVTNGAVAIHKSSTVPSSNLRRPEKLKEAKDYFKNKYGLDV